MGQSCANGAADSALGPSGRAAAKPNARRGRGTNLAVAPIVFWSAEYAQVHVPFVVLAAFGATAAYLWPPFARLGFAALFAAMSTFHWVLAMLHPEMYLGCANLAVFDVYREVIGKMSPSDVILAVGGLSTMLAVVTLGMVVGDGAARASLAVATAFLLLLAPLGVGAAFPATLLLAAGTSLLACTPTALAGSLSDAVGRSLSQRRQRDVQRAGDAPLAEAEVAPEMLTEVARRLRGAMQPDKMLRRVAEFETRTKRREPTMRS